MAGLRRPGRKTSRAGSGNGPRTGLAGQAARQGDRGACRSPYKWTLPEISVCVPPPIQIVPSASLVTWTRPRRPSTVPWLAV